MPRYYPAAFHLARQELAVTSMLNEIDVAHLVPRRVRGHRNRVLALGPSNKLIDQVCPSPHRIIFSDFGSLRERVVDF